MKRLVLLMLCILSLITLSSCKEQTEERICKNFQFPIEFDATFSIDALSGTARFVIKEDELNFGVTDGDLRSLVAHITPDQTRLLYQGMDLSFPAKSTQALQDLHQAFIDLASSHFRNVEKMSDPERIQYSRSTPRGVLQASFDPQDYSFRSLKATFDGTEITLKIL